jgi:tRNA G37 N-methylase TrmD
MTKYQDQILKDLKNGAKLQCTEGRNYKTWLVYPDGTKRKVRRDSADKVCAENESILIFGRHDGIAHRKALII